MALLERCVRKSYARNVIARILTAELNGASPNFKAQRRRRRRRCREDRVLWGYELVTDWKFRTQKYADTAYVGAGRPFTTLLGQHVRQWDARNVIARELTA